MQINQFTDYALRILMYCALHDERAVRTGEIADAYGISEVGSSRVDLQACKLEYSIVSPK